MSDFEATMVSNVVRYLVQRNIFCSVTKNVLDERTCDVLYSENTKNIIDVFDPAVREGMSEVNMRVLFTDKGFRFVTPPERHTIAL